ncbi:hypothetical protein BGW39_009723 [Mortierella sp. 14UC]|nr:hypothetical protein BGW39_009723 [Mortierella sp. 14UC]
MLHLTRPASAHLSHLNPFSHGRARFQHPKTSSVALARVLDIPLLCDEIASTLTPFTLSLCTRVCRTWHQAFSPVLWADLSFVNQYTVSLFRTSTAIQTAILKHAHHVRTIHSVFCYTFESLPIRTDLFQNLTRLDSLASELHNKGIVDHTNAVRLLQFIKVNTSLREIRLTVFPLANEAVSELLGATLAEHPGLVTASITCFTEAHLVGMRYVLRGAAMGRLESLRLTCRASHSAFNGSSTALSASALAGSTMDQEQGEQQQLEALLPEGYVARYFKELQVDAEMQGIYHLTILPLLQHCPHMESLLVTGLDMARSMQGLCKVLESTTTQLRHLTIASANGQDGQYAGLLDACQTDRLQSLVLQNGLFINRLSILALLSYSRQHRFTLQVLDFENCYGIESKDLQLILTSCPNLMTFLAMAPPRRTTGNSSISSGGGSGGSISGGVGTAGGGMDMRISIKDLPTGMGNKAAWVCLRLQHLSIGFSGFSSLRPSNSNRTTFYSSDDNDYIDNSNASASASAKIYVDHIYSQLALLTELRTLRLGGDIEPAGGYGPGIGTGPASSSAVAYPTESLSPTTSSSSPSLSETPFDLTMNSGLGRLETLKRLQELDVERIWHHRISARECAWMARSWPQLRTFRGSASAAFTGNSWEGGGSGAGAGAGGVKKPVYVNEMKRYCPKVDVWIGLQRV